MTYYGQLCSTIWISVVVRNRISINNNIKENAIEYDWQVERAKQSADVGYHFDTVAWVPVRVDSTLRLLDPPRMRDSRSWLSQHCYGVNNL